MKKQLYQVAKQSGGGGGSPIYSHSIRTSDGSGTVEVQFYSSIAEFGNSTEFFDFLSEHPKVTGWFITDGGQKYYPLYSVSQGFGGNDLSLYYILDTNESFFAMITDMSTFTDISIEI